jgi:hypothetical protein
MIRLSLIQNNLLVLNCLKQTLNNALFCYNLGLNRELFIKY